MTQEKLNRLKELLRDATIGSSQLYVSLDVSSYDERDELRELLFEIAYEEREDV